jgi:cyanophycinase-like exopeptidase
LIEWPSGAGWLVLLGGGAWEQGDTRWIDVAALSVAEPGRQVVFIPAAGGRDGIELLDYFEDLGALPGIVAPLRSPEDAARPEVYRLLTQAGVIYLGDGDSRKLVETLAGSAALEGIAAAYRRGAVIVGAGAGAVSLAAWGRANGGDNPLAGWGWLPDAVVEPHFEGEAAALRLREMVARTNARFGLGIPERTALALAPDGAVETWGAGQVTISLPQR